MIESVHRPETAIAIEATRAALDLARSGHGAHDVRSKGPRDLVTATDVAAEDTIRSVLGGLPGSTVVGEERGGVTPAGGSPYWLVDPICGTANFASGIPLYCVNLALVEDGQVTVAVVGDGSTGEIYAAERGRGAWAVDAGSGHRLAVRGASGIIVLQEGMSQDTRRERAGQFAAAVIGTDRWHVRALGTTLPSAYLAAGRIAAYVEFFAPALHTAAGALLAAQAGATVTDIDGKPWTISSDSVIASAAPGLHRELLDIAAAPANPADGTRHDR
jgi:myo-inositol-1(or 4)-monophosphatase